MGSNANFDDKMGLWWTENLPIIKLWSSYLKISRNGTENAGVK